MLRSLLFSIISLSNFGLGFGGDEHQYWRVIAPGRTKWALIEARWLDNEGQILKHGIPISSGQHAEWCDANMALDSNTNSYWLESTTETSGRWLGVKFDHPVIATAEVLQYSHSNYRSFVAELHYSDDGLAWHFKGVAELDGSDADDVSIWEAVPSKSESAQIDFL